MRKTKLQIAIAAAKEMGSPWVEVDGIRIPLMEPQVRILESNVQADEDVAKALAQNPFDNMTDEEILFYATPYFDEIQAKKLAREKALEEEKQVREPDGQ